MSFHDALFPTDLSYGSKSGASFSTAIKQSDSGVERRSAEWELDRHRMQYDVAKSVQTEDDLAAVLDFYLCMRGSACGFRFKDVTDFSTAADGTSTPTSFEDAHVATTVGTATESWQMRKQYANDIALGVEAFDRVITRPIPPEHDDHHIRIYWGGQLVWRSVGSGPETMALGVQAAIDYSTGRVIFNSAPSGEVRIACTFHVPARFGEDVDAGLEMTWEAAGSFEITSLVICEITGDPNSAEEEWMENGHEVLPEVAGQIYGYETPDFSVHHEEVTATTNGAAFYLPQYITTATSGFVPQTPLVSGEFFTGGPMHLISSSSTSTGSLDVFERSATGLTFGNVATLSANQYVELWWMGNAIGMEAR